MSDQDLNFLKFIYNEDLYLVEDTAKKSSSGLQADPAEIQTDLIETIKEEGLQKTQEPAPAYQAKQKDILILVENDSQNSLSESDLAYLIKILAAVKVNEQDIDLINVSQNSEYLQKEYQKILSFTPNHQLSDVGELYSLHHSGNSQIIVADDLKTLAASTDLRRKLWAALQEMFKS